MTAISDLVYIDSTGYHYADFPTFQQWLIGVYQGIYGADTDVDPNTQDGQFLAILAQAFYDTAAVGNSGYNSFSPTTAQGVGLSRLVKLNGLTREVPSFSTVTLTIVGTTGTVIANGIAQDTLQQQWLLPATVTIPDAGTIDVTATAALVGQVFADASTVTTIFTPTRGWQTVTNASPATPGAPVETDAQLRARQAVSTELPSLTVFQGTLGSVANVPGVTKVSNGYENATGSDDGNGIPAHSISVVVAGGVSVDIAQAIQIHKTPGCGTAGDTATTVYDSHGMPIVIRFQRTVATTITATITGTVQNGWASSTADLIAAAVANILNAIGIGQVVQYTTLFGPAFLPSTPEYGTFTISSIVIGKNSGMQSASNIDLAYDEDPICDPTTDITVSIS